jgi:Putative Actinobacterial Holin-X, holin superfamily III
MLDAFARLLDAVQVLVRENLALARSELKREVRGLARGLSPAAIGVPLLLSGWILLMGAVALSLPLPAWAAFGIVATANLAAGAALTQVALRRVPGGGPALPAAPANEHAVAVHGSAPQR